MIMAYHIHGLSKWTTSEFKRTALHGLQSRHVSDLRATDMGIGLVGARQTDPRDRDVVVRRS